MKRKITSHINQQLGEDATLTVLAEAEPLQAYPRKRYAMSFEKPTTPTKIIKLHSASEDRHTWSHDDATALLSHPAEQKSTGLKQQQIYTFLEKMLAKF